MFFKLLIVSSVLVAANAHPSLQLLAQLQSEEVAAISAQPTLAPTPTVPEDAPLPAPEETTVPSSVAPEEEQESAVSQTIPTALPASSIAPIDLSSLGQTVTVQHHVQPAQVIHSAISVPTILATGVRTVYAPETIKIHQPTVAKVGDLVQKIPTAVSHQSQTIVHNHAEVRTPIVAPAVRTITKQVLRAYHTPLVYAAHAPVVKYIH